MRFAPERSLISAVILFMTVVALSGCRAGAPAPNQATAVPPTPAIVRTSELGSADLRQAPTGAPVSALAAKSMTEEGPVLRPEISGDIELWHFWGSPVRHNALRRVIALCQQRLPNIKVTDAVMPFGDIWAANLAAVAEGAGMPDVIVSDRRTLPRDAGDGVYMSLESWAERDRVTRSQFYSWAWDQGLYKGQIYGIPHETDVTVLFYNKNLFRQAGLDPNKPPQTWADVEAYADKLDKIGPDGQLVRAAFFPLWNRGVDVWSYTNDAAMIQPDGTPSIDNPKMVATVEWIKKWVDRYGGWDNVQSFRSQFGDAPEDIFMSSGVAMYVDIFGYNSQLQFYRPSVTLDNGESAALDWGIALLPYNVKPGTWSGGFALSIPAGAKNPAAAWEFIKCATSSEAQVSWARDTQAQPTNLQAATDPSLMADPAWQIVDQALQTSTGGVYVSRYPNWIEQLTQRWEMVWRGELSAAQMLSEAQRAVEEWLQ